MAITEKMHSDVMKLKFPEGKSKALTFSYDDGRIYDRRLVEVFSHYGMKATFHLNSGVLGKLGFVGSGEVKQLYYGHEVACHSVTHPFFNELSQGQMIREILEDRQALECYTNRFVRGFSYPFGEYSDRLIAIAKSLGIVYARTVEDTMNYNLPSDFMLWNPTSHHDKVTETLMDDYLNPPIFRNMALMYIWGHSFEFEQNNNWNHIVQICERLQGREDIWYATNMEIYEYVTAMRSLVLSADGKILYNPTSIPVYFVIGNRVTCILSGETINFRYSITDE